MLHAIETRKYPDSSICFLYRFIEVFQSERNLPMLLLHAIAIYHPDCTGETMIRFLRLSFVISLLLLLGTLSQAQVVIDEEDIPTAAGTYTPYYTLSDPQGNIEVDVGDEGGNETWDLTVYEYQGIEYDSLVDPTTTPHYDYFPDANRVVVPGGSEGSFIESFRYEMVADSGWYLLGIGISAGLGEEGLNFPIPFPDGVMLMPFPAEYGDEWNISASYDYYYTSDTLAFDTLRLEIAVGGFGELDAWGEVQYPSGTTDALRLHESIGIVVNAYAIQWLFGIRLEIPLGEVFSMDASQVYQWYAPDLGEIASITSRAFEEEPEFEFATSVRSLFIPPLLEFPVEGLAFGEIIIGEANQAELVIQNSGEGLGTISQVTAESPYTYEIVAASELPFFVLPGDEDNLILEWTPSELGEHYGALELHHNDPLLPNPLTVPFSGTVVEPPGLVISAELDYGNVILGTTAASTVTINNNASGSGYITGITIPSELEAEFNIFATFPLILEPWESDEIRIEWTPSSEMELTTEFDVYHNDPLQMNPFPVTVTGFAYIPPELVFQESSVDFGVVDVGEQELNLLTIENNGEGVGRIDEIVIPGNEAGDVTIIANLPLVIEPGETERITIAWQPSEEGFVPDELQVYHNDPYIDNPYIITLVGTTSGNSVLEGEYQPDSYYLAQNTPNPFNPSTTIRFGVAEPGVVTLRIFDLTGRLLDTPVSTWYSSGEHSIEFHGADLPSGTYFYSLNVNGFSAFHKMILLK